MVNRYNECREQPTPAGRSIGRREFLGTVGSGAAVSVAGCLGDEVDEDVIRIGHLAPLELDMGIGSERSAEIAVDEINDDGGIMDTEVELVSVNTEAIPSEGLREAEGLIEGENVDVLVGTHASEVTLAMLDLVSEVGIPFLVTGSADPEVFSQHAAEEYQEYRMVFRPGPLNSVYQIEELADYAEYLNEEHGWTTFAQLAEEAAWTGVFSEELPSAFEDRGFEVPYNERIASDTDDFSPILGNLEGEDVEVIMKQFSLLPGTGMLSSWRANEYPFAQEGVSVPSMSPEYWDDTNGGCEYETTGESGAAGVAELTENTVPFAEEYESRHSEERPSGPMYMGFGTYDAIHVYSEAVERAGTFDYREELDTIVDAMLETEYTGTTGVIEFGDSDAEFPNDVLPDQTIYPITQWIDGGKECVFPRESATADHIAPEWL
jgi:branched-chain amino acid transport system substrate-binding protein